MDFRFENYIIKAFLASSLLALLMMILAFGLIQFFRSGPALTLSVILILAAISFVLSASFFDKYEIGSIMLSMVVSIIATLTLMLLAGGIVYLLSDKRILWDEILSGLAVCVIVSMTLLDYLKRSLTEIEH